MFQNSFFHHLSRSKLECLSLVNLVSLIWFGKKGREVPSRKSQIWTKIPAKKKHSSLFVSSVSGEEKSFITLAPMGTFSWRQVQRYFRKVELFGLSYANFVVKNLISQSHCALCCKTFYRRNLQMFVIRYIVCLWQAFLASYDVCR